MKYIPVAEPVLGEPEVEAVADCVRSGWISSKGKYVEEFEAGFAEFCHAKYAVSTSNGTTALHLALAALGIGPGDEVIVPTLTFIATANAVRYTGASVVLVDSELRTWGMAPDSVEAAFTERTKALIPVHLYGHPCDMQAINEIASRHGVKVVEDAAEAHGASVNGQPVGSLSLAGCFSFYGNKILTTGEGGMVITNDAEFADQMRYLRDHAMRSSRPYWHDVIGFNYRMTNLQASIGVAQLSRVAELLRRKREIANTYSQLLAEVPGISLPPEEPWAQNVYWMYSVLLDGRSREQRDEVIEELRRKGIESRPFFYPMHQMPPYFSQECYPNAEVLSATGINLPSSPLLSIEDIERVANTLREIVGATR